MIKVAILKKLSWKKYTLLILAIPIVHYVGGQIGQHSAKQVNAKELSNPPLSPDIQVFVTSQDAEGVTTKQMNQNFLKNLETYIVELTKVKINEYLTSKGYPNTKIHLTSEAVYIQSGPQKIAIIRLKGSNSNHVVAVGVTDKELKRITCISNSVELVSISYGACGDKIKEVFNIKI